MFVKPRNVPILLLSIAAFSAVSVQAADVPLRGPIPFDSFDKNGDKMISPQEFVETHNQRIQMRTDANMPMRRMVGTPAFTWFDENGDNLISAEELETGRANMRQQRGMPRQNTSSGMAPGMAPDMAPDMAPGMAPGMPRGMPRQGMSRGMAPGPRGMGRGMYRGRQMPAFDELDLNGDGAMTKEEFNEARGKRMRERAEQGRMLRHAANAPAFEDLDTDKDASISPEEFSAHQTEQLRTRRRP